MRLRTFDAFLLLVHDDVSGRCLVSERRWQRTAAGVAILELVEDGALALDLGSSRVHGTGRPPADPALASLLSHAAGARLVRAATTTEGLLPGMRGIVDDVLDARLGRLAQAGLLSPRERRVLGIVVDVEWLPGARRDVEAALRGRMLAALRGQVPVDEEAGALLAILHPTGALPAIFPEVDRRLLIDEVGALVARTWLAQAMFALAREPGRTPYERGLL